MKNTVTLEILSLDISRDSKRLLIAAGVPSYELSIWDLETGERLTGNNSTV